MEGVPAALAPGRLDAIPGEMFGRPERSASFIRMKDSKLGKAQFSDVQYRRVRGFTSEEV